MNLDTPSSASSGPLPPNQRKERGAIAAQACDTCRSRKQKCDEARPKCSLCARMNLECRYREPQPTKKDKTLVEILDRLKSLESKLDQIPLQTLGQQILGSDGKSIHSQLSFASEGDQPSGSTISSQNPSPRGLNHPYRHASAAHKMLTWPAIQNLLSEAVPSSVGDLVNIEIEGSAFIVRNQQDLPPLPLDDLPPERPFIGMQTRATRVTGARLSTFPGLTYDVMFSLATVYFDTFNLLYPFMDRQTFMSETLAKVHSEGFDGDDDSIIALLVFALGELAQQSMEGASVDFYEDRASGLRGGSVERPPGLALFNAARKRIGFVLTECGLTNIQIFSLAGLYFESCSRHVDFWRLAVTASQACQILITCTSIDWSSQRGDMISRAFWHCAIIETGLHLELDLPLTGLLALEDQVPLPTFAKFPFNEPDDRADNEANFRAHYASQIALRRLCATLHDDINNSMGESGATSKEGLLNPSAAVLKQISLQLDAWRSLLPDKLRWPEDDPTAYPTGVPISTIEQQSHPVPDATGLRPALFSTDLDRPSMNMRYLYDIHVALLRTRYYYAKYMVHRPFIYKALHFPDLMTKEDAEGAAICLQSCLKWPLSLSPPSRHKRLIPYLFCWSQNFSNILLLFHLSYHNPTLSRIRQQLCGENFDTNARESIMLMLDYIRDLKSVDRIAAWCYNIVKGVYQLDE